MDYSAYSYGLREFRELGGLLRLFSSCECTDPRDKIFAFLGMLPDNQRDAIRRYLPNYRLSEEEVIVIAIAHLRCYSWHDLQSYQSSHILLQDKSPETTARLTKTALAFESLERQGSSSAELERDDIPETEQDFVAPAKKLMTAALSLRCPWESTSIRPEHTSTFRSIFITDNEPTLPSRATYLIDNERRRYPRDFSSRPDLIKVSGEFGISKIKTGRYL